MKLLLTAKADPHVRDSEGDTCLHYVARVGNISILNILIEFDMCPDIQNKVSIWEHFEKSVLVSN